MNNLSSPQFRSKENLEKWANYQPEQWRNDKDNDRALLHTRQNNPDARQQSLLLDLLGRINYKILTGDRVYVEVEGVVYKTLYGGYWCSVFTGIQHYLLRCEEIRSSTWAGETGPAAIVDLPISFSPDGWQASGHSLSFILSRD